MKIGIVSQWRNQGQATLSRHLRDALAARGHETFVLARPTRDEHILPGAIDAADVWDQPDVETASNYKIPAEEYLAWAKRTGIEACFFNQNYQFKELRRLRDAGVRNIGYFVWESFRQEHVAPAQDAYECIYSLNRCTRERYQRLGIDSPELIWGVHPELLAVSPQKADDGLVRFFFPAGMSGPRKPIAAVVSAFRKVDDPRARLILKGQLTGPQTERADIDGDPRIDHRVEDMLTDAYLNLFASADVCIGVSRWEGTGLHFLETTAFGIPMITNDIPPMNEWFEDGRNGRLVRSHVAFATKSGVPAVDPDPEDLRRAICELLDDDLRGRLREGALAQRELLAWERTILDFGRLVEGLR